MSPTEPRSEQEIRADLATARAGLTREVSGPVVASWSGEKAVARLVADVAPLLDALSAALAAKEQMHQLTLFAVALNRMAQAATAGTGVELNADEVAAMVMMVGSLSAKARSDAAPPEELKP